MLVAIWVIGCSGGGVGGGGGVLQPKIPFPLYEELIFGLGPTHGGTSGARKYIDLTLSP